MCVIHHLPSSQSIILPAWLFTGTQHKVSKWHCVNIHDPCYAQYGTELSVCLALINV